jgi:hypothetical protein
VIPTPAALDSRFDLVFAVRSNDVMLLDEARMVADWMLRRRTATGVRVVERAVALRRRLARTTSWVSRCVSDEAPVRLDVHLNKEPADEIKMAAFSDNRCWMRLW